MFALGCLAGASIPLFRGALSLGAVALLASGSIAVGLVAGRLIRRGVGAFWVLVGTALLPGSVLVGISPSAGWVYAWAYYSGLFIAALLFPARQGSTKKEDP